MTDVAACGSTLASDRRSRAAHPSFNPQKRPRVSVRSVPTVANAASQRSLGTPESGWSAWMGPRSHSALDPRGL